MPGQALQKRHVIEDDKHNGNRAQRLNVSALWFRPQRTVRM
jgi:hypothetical protein